MIILETTRESRKGKLTIQDPLSPYAGVNRTIDHLPMRQEAQGPIELMDQEDAQSRPIP